MATKASEGGNGFFRTLLQAQFDAYLKVAVRKHGLSTDMLRKDASSMSNEELAAAVTTLRDLAHLPPE